MAENTQEKKEKKGFFAGISRTFKETRGEMKKVVWPSWKQGRNNTMVVLIFMVAMAAVISLFDLGLNSLITSFLLGRGA